ncbi:MAG: helicase, partial [Proteobacteria bacterium]|nr:helicase [Pseudomonadota bacterium]
MTPTDTLLAILDPDPVLRGRQFERFVVTLLRTHPLWASELADVWPWAAWPGRWGPDCGIDAVARTHDGRTIAIQAKAYAPGHRITKADLDTFVSESARPGIDGRMLVATTDLLATNADRLCADLDPPVTRVLKSHLDHALDGWDLPSLLGDHPSGMPPARPAPRPHQSEAITAVVDGLASTDRGQLLMACGTGKTLTTLWIAETLGSGCTLVLVPSLGLLSQTLHAWTRAASGPLHTLCVCSDDTVRASDDAPISRASDLGIPATTDPAVVTRFLASRGRRVVFATYQSSAVITQAQSDPAVPAFDLAVADEAHRIAGDAGEAYKAVLDPSRIRATRRIFATATPRIFSPSVRKAAADRGVEVTGMDDDARFGPVLHRLPFGEAISRDLLTDYRVVIMVIDDATVAEWVTGRELLRTPEGGTRDARSVATLVGLLKAIRDYGLHRVISFHGRVAGAQGFAHDLGSAATWVRGDHLPEGTIEARLVSGAMPAGERRRDLDWLRAAGNGRRGILTNARCLSEGIDVPSLDGVAFIDPKRSQVDITQAVGRAIRKSPGKELGTIVLPVFVRPGDDARAMVEASDFRDVWGVIAALRAQDPGLGAELDAIRTRMGREPGYRPATQDLSRIVIDVPLTVGFEVGDAIRTAVVERGTDTWEFWFGLLGAYVAEMGHCRVPADLVTMDGYRLGSWVVNIRAGNILLTDLRRSKLEALPGWTWDALDSQWEEGFRQLEAYRAGKGDCLVPANHVTGDAYQLGIWVGGQRSKRDTMPAERKSRLE